MMTSTPGMSIVAEGDAEIDHQPLAGMAVEVEVHADLAGAAQRQEQQLVVPGAVISASLLRLRR